MVKTSTLAVVARLQIVRGACMKEQKDPCQGCPYVGKCNDDPTKCILSNEGWKDPNKVADKNIEDCRLILERFEVLDPETGIGNPRSGELGWG